MTDSPPNPESAPADEVAAEFRQLGKNLTDILHNAWASNERKKLQQEIEAGLTELGNTLCQAAADLSASPTTQSLKAELEDLRQRLESGEVEAQVRQEVLSALRAANAELNKVAARPPFDQPKT